MPRKKKIEQDIESKEIESKEIESKPKEIESTPLEDNRTLAQKLANYHRPLRRI